MNKNDILIVSALEVETQDQLNDYEVIYTGVGKVNATYELTSYFAIPTIDILFNITMTF